MLNHQGVINAQQTIPPADEIRDVYLALYSAQRFDRGYRCRTSKVFEMAVLIVLIQTLVF